MTRIAVASGKGGTGKTSVAVLLSHFLAGESGNVSLFDCDVEAPNLGLFFPEKKLLSKKVISASAAQIDNTRCTFCRKCIEYCEFNAIVVIPGAEFAEVNTSLCHACGACACACPENAIAEIPSETGTISFYRLSKGVILTEGRLKVGSAMQTSLIREVKKEYKRTTALALFDAPPGTTCPVVQTVKDTDFVVLVTEPTPFGLSDLKLSIELLKDMQLPFGVIINKSDVGNGSMLSYLVENGHNLLGTIPFDKHFAEQYATGNLATAIQGRIGYHYSLIVNNLIKIIGTPG